MIVNKAIHSAKQSPFLKAIVLLSSGSIIAQGIRAIGTMGLTRLYSAETMGIYSYLISVSAIFMGIANLRYDVSIVTDSDTKHIFPLIKLSLLVGLVVTVLSSVGFGIYFFFVKKPIIWAVLVFFNVAAYGLVNVLTAYNNRNKEYKLITSMYIVRTGTQFGLSLLLGLINPLAVFLLVPYVLGEYMGVGRQFRSLRPHFKEVLSCPANEVKEVARLHKKQLFFSTPALLANSLSYSLITIFMESLFGMETVGYYSVSVTLLGVPLAVIGTNISKVFVQKASEEYALSGTCKHSVNRTSLILLCLAIPMVLIMFIWGTPLCSILFGKQWAYAGSFIAILAPMFGVRFITSALTPAMVVLKKQQVEFMLQAVFLASNLVSFILAKYYAWDVEEFLTCVSVLFTLSYILYLLVIFIYSHAKTH